MKKFILLLIISLLFFISCGPQSVLFTQGASGHPGELSSEYHITNLEDVEGQSSTFLGISDGVNNKFGNIKNFISTSTPGPDLISNNSQKNIISFFNILLSSVSFGTVGYSLTNDASGTIIGSLFGVLLGGAINETLHKNRSLVDATSIASRKLIEQNPEIDLFIFPKYNINTNNRIFASNASVSIRAKGAKLKEEIILNQDSLYSNKLFFMSPNTQNINIEPVSLEEKQNVLIGINKMENNQKLEVCDCQTVLQKTIDSSSYDERTLYLKCKKLLRSYKVHTDDGLNNWQNDARKGGCFDDK